MGDDAKLPIEDVADWIDTLFYLDSSRLKQNSIKASLEIYDGMTLEKCIKYKPKPFADLISKIIPGSIKKKDLTSVCFINGDTSLVESTKMLIQNDNGSTSVEMQDIEKLILRTGYIHVAFSVGSKEKVDRLTELLKSDGYELVIGPRTTGDGYYESCIVGIEGNQIEITV